MMKMELTINVDEAYVFITIHQKQSNSQITVQNLMGENKRFFNTIMFHLIHQQLPWLNYKNYPMNCFHIHTYCFCFVSNQKETASNKKVNTKQQTPNLSKTQRFQYYSNGINDSKIKLYLSVNYAISYTCQLNL